MVASVCSTIGNWSGRHKRFRVARTRRRPPAERFGSALLASIPVRRRLLGVVLSEPFRYDRTVVTRPCRTRRTGALGWSVPGAAGRAQNSTASYPKSIPNIARM